MTCPLPSSLFARTIGGGVYLISRNYYDMAFSGYKQLKVRYITLWLDVMLTANLEVPL